MSKLKINYRHPDGTRTSTTLPEHIYLTWVECLEQPPTSREALARAISDRLEEGLKKFPSVPGKTQQERIESLLMSDVRAALWSLSH